MGVGVLRDSTGATLPVTLEVVSILGGVTEPLADNL